MGIPKGFNEALDFDIMLPPFFIVKLGTPSMPPKTV